MKDQAKMRAQLANKLRRMRRRIVRLEKAEVELKRTEEALLASQIRLAEAMDLASVVYWEFDLKADKFVFNDPFYAFYGTTAEQEGGHLMSKPEYVKRFVHPEDAHIFAGVAEALKLHRGREFLYHTEHRIIRRSGEVRHIIARISVSKDRKGNIIRYHGASQDITDRVKAIEALRESEGRFKGAFESAAIGMALVGLDGRFLKANQALCDSLGYSEEEMLTRTIESLTHPEDLENDLEHRRRLLDDQFPYYQLEKKYIHRDGYTVWTSSSESLVRDTQGHPLYFVVHIENITERKFLEEKIRTISITDELTDLYNRRGFFTLAEQQIRLSLRTGERFALFFIDLDGMKWINDTLGHHEGDGALMAVAQILKDTFRRSDIIGRMGGDEFAVLAVGAGDAQSLTSRLRANVEKFNNGDGRDWPLSLSMGLARCEPEHFCSFEALIAEADAAMYEEKRRKKAQRAAVVESALLQGSRQQAL